MRFHSRVALAAILLTASVATISAQRELRRVFASVTTATGVPVLDLKAEDFVLVEDGKTVPIVRVARADPVRIALVVDSSSIESFSNPNAAPYLIDMRKALPAFFDALLPEHEVGFFTTGRQMRARVPFTTDRTRLQRAAAEFSSDGGGNTLLNSVREIEERFMRQPADRWPVWVIVTADGPEMSRPAPPDDVWARLVHGLVVKGATVHAVAVQFVGGAFPTEIAMNLTEWTGGLYVPLVGNTGTLTEQLERIAKQIDDGDRQMSTKFILEYNTDFKAPGDVTVGTVRTDLRVQVSAMRPF